jgi:hypothetical protein
MDIYGYLRIFQKSLYKQNNSARVLGTCSAIEYLYFIGVVFPSGV